MTRRTRCIQDDHAEEASAAVCGFGYAIAWHRGSFIVLRREEDERLEQIGEAGNPMGAVQVARRDYRMNRLGMDD